MRTLIAVINKNPRSIWQRLSKSNQAPLMIERNILFKSYSNTPFKCGGWKVDAFSGLVSSTEKDKPKFQVKVGLEIHAQLNTRTKLFSSAETIVGASNMMTPANHPSHVAPYDVAVPGTLPVLSADCVRLALLAAAALKCDVQEVSRFERKHYTYADLPFGYQITQQRWPFATDGCIEFETEIKSGKKGKKSKKNDSNNDTVKCRVNRIQLEQDTGKTTNTSKTSVHMRGDETITTTKTFSQVDFNRAGTALIEIVTEPDLKSSQQAASCVQIVRQLLKHCNACLGKMEQGQLRVDANVNVLLVKEEDDKQQPAMLKSPRVEIKNLNSIKQVQLAIDHEAKRHAQFLLDSLTNSTPPPTQEETRTWNVALNQTELIRRKDGQEDYRFMPDPDLPPLVLSSDPHLLEGMSVNEYIETHLPEMPAAAMERIMSLYGLSEYQAKVIASDPPAIRILDTAIQTFNTNTANNNDNVKKAQEAATTIANLLCNELFALVKDHVVEQMGLDEQDASVEYSKVNGEQLGEIAVLLVAEECISKTMAKKLLSILYQEEKYQGVSPREVAKECGFQLITNEEELRAICEQIIAKHPEEVELYHQGGKFVSKMTKLFTGKAMAASKGNAHPERLQEVLEQVLEEAQ